MNSLLHMCGSGSVVSWLWLVSIAASIRIRQGRLFKKTTRSQVIGVLAENRSASASTSGCEDFNFAGGDPKPCTWYMCDSHKGVWDYLGWYCGPHIEELYESNECLSVEKPCRTTECRVQYYVQFFKHSEIGAEAEGQVLRVADRVVFPILRGLSPNEARRLGLMNQPWNFQVGPKREDLETIWKDPATSPWDPVIYDARILWPSWYTKAALAMTDPRYPYNKVVFFHNSPGSNWAHREHHDRTKIRVEVSGENFFFMHTEGILMACKEQLVKENAGGLKFTMSQHGSSHPGSKGLDAKMSKARANIRSSADARLWDMPSVKVILCAAACLLKFSQIKPFWVWLDSTGTSIILEAAPEDGTWGVGKNPYTVWKHIYNGWLNPRDYVFDSNKETKFAYRRDGWLAWNSIMNANDLGKALMLVRHVLRADGPKPTARYDFVVAVGEVITLLNDLPTNLDVLTAEKELLRALGILEM